MTELLQNVIDRLSRLPESEQNRYAARFLRALEEEGLEEIEAGGEASQPTAYERSKHLAGVFEGPGDLSTNPSYLDDLGKSSLR